MRRNAVAAIVAVISLGVVGVVMIFAIANTATSQSPATPVTSSTTQVEEGVVVYQDKDNVTSLFYTCDAAVLMQCLQVDGYQSTAIDCDPIPEVKRVEVCQ